MKFGYRSDHLGTLIQEIWNGPCSHIGVVTVRLIDNANRLEFMAGSAYPGLESTRAVTIMMGVLRN